MNNRFEIGHAYYASPAIEGARQRIVIPIGRSGSEIQFAFIDDLSNANVEPIAGVEREFVRMLTGEGLVYGCSCASEVPASESARVLSIIKGGRDDH